jgi:hypothetical protein
MASPRHIVSETLPRSLCVGVSPCLARFMTACVARSFTECLEPLMQLYAEASAAAGFFHTGIE